jgi:amino acid transporter
MTINMDDEIELTPRYLKWTFDFVVYLVMAIVILYFADSLLFEERRFKYDFSKTSIGIALILMAIMIFRELGIFISFLNTELGRKLYFSSSTGTLRVEKNNKSDSLSLNDLSRVTFSQQRFSSRSPTMNLEYSELIFKTGQTILITSYVMNTHKLEKLFGNRKYKKSYRNRGNFEGIRKTSTAANKRCYVKQ